MSTEDEEALAWAGDNDERLTTGSTSTSPVRKRRASPSPSPQSVAESMPVAEQGDAVTPGTEWWPRESLSDADGDADGESDDNETPGGLSSGEGIFIGIFGGIYLLFSAAWIVSALRNPVQIADPLGSFMFIFGLWMAAAAPAAWFSATMIFGRRRSFLWRLLSLALGAALVIPWPYFIRGA